MPQTLGTTREKAGPAEAQKAAKGVKAAAPAAAQRAGRSPRRSAKREAILETAERLFYDNGFHATGIDRIVGEAGVTPRTLYNHFASKDDLVCAVLRRREARYFSDFDEYTAAREQLHGDAVRAVFEALARWLNGEAARGCMFISALSEYPDEGGEVGAIVAAHKARVRDGLRQRLAAMGIESDESLVGGLLLLMEGATGLAPVLGSDKAAAYAIDAAQALLAAKRAETHSPTTAKA